MTGLPVRFLFRDTQTYQLMLNDASLPRFLRDGADRSVALDALSKPLVRPGGSPRAGRSSPPSAGHWSARTCRCSPPPRARPSYGSTTAEPSPGCSPGRVTT